MCAAQRIWPSVQALGRGLVSSRGEIIQQGVKAYNAQNFSQPSTYTHHNTFPGSDRFPWSHKILHNARGSFNKVVMRSLHSGNVLFAKNYTDNENEHAHAVLCSLPAYHATTVMEEGHERVCVGQLQFPTYNLDWVTCSIEDLVNGFISTSQQCRYRPMDLEDTKYSTLCSALATRLQSLSDSQLKGVLYALSLWPPTDATTTPNFVVLWNSLDEACTSRIWKWDMSQILLIADHWYTLRLSRITKYNTQMTKTLGRQVGTMQPSQLVQFLFYANLCRRLEPFIIKKEMEKRLIGVLEHISIEELGVIAMGFFKTQTFLKNEKLIEMFVSKTRENLECVSNPSLCSILKLLRKSVPTEQSQLLYDLLDSLVPQLSRLNNMCLLQIALLGNDLLIFHPTSLEKIVERFAEDMSTLRLKDIERLTFALMLYNYVPLGRPDIFSLVAEELRKPNRLPEINMYPKSFASCVAYLTSLAIFPQDLISAVLQPSMLDLLDLNKSYWSMGRLINELDWTLEIEGPSNYRGYRLHPHTRAKLTKEHLSRLPTPTSKNLTHQDRLLLDVCDKVGEMLGGARFTELTHVLPHHMPDIVFCTNSEGEPVDIPDKYINLPATSLKRPLTTYNDIRWNVVVLAGRNAYIRNTDMLRGIVQTKCRQLTNVGYSVSVVPYKRYHKKSLRNKLGTLERILSQNSTLNTHGRVKDAMLSIKSHELQDE